jgi:hypothetical protein
LSRTFLDTFWTHSHSQNNRYVVGWAGSNCIVALVCIVLALHALSLYSVPEVKVAFIAT